MEKMITEEPTMSQTNVEDSKDDIEKQLKSLKRLPTIPERLMVTASSSCTSSDEITDLLNITKEPSKSTEESDSVLTKIVSIKLDKLKLPSTMLKDVDENTSEQSRLPTKCNKETETINMRRKADRAKLNGWDCWECEKYYKNLSLSKDELQKRKNQSSRHRHKYERPKTPEGFWDPDFPETQPSECTKPALKGGCIDSEISQRQESCTLDLNHSKTTKSEENDALQANDSKTFKCEESTINEDNHLLESSLLVHERENKSKRQHHFSETIVNTKVCNDSELKEKISFRQQNSKLKSRIEELFEHNDKLRGERKEIKRKLEEAMSELINVKKLNERLQTALIDKANECETKLKTVLSANINMQYNYNFPPIGTRRSTDAMIHIGRNEWISEIHYNRVCNSSKTPRQFASNIIFPLFDDKLLMTSTITGYTSARRGEKKPCNKLDEKKLGACEDIYRHWINNTYKTKFVNAPHKDNSMKELSKFYYYVGKKLADFKKSSISHEKVYTDKNAKRPKNSDKNKSKKSKSSEVTDSDEQSKDTEDNSQINDENVMRSKNSGKENKISKTSEETDERNEEDVIVEDLDDYRFYDDSPEMID